MAHNEPDISASTVSWRDQAVSRSLDPARVRAESRVQRFFDAAMELMHENASGKEFTVQEVVERSGQSLRSFYQYFGGKQELLLALFEEAVGSTADELREMVAEEADASARLHRFVVEYYRICRPAGANPPKKAPSRTLAEFAQQLLTSEPAEAARAFVPLVSLFEEVLAEAEQAGLLRAGIPRRRVAGIVLEAIMFNAFSTTISGPAGDSGGVDAGEQLWDLLYYGIGVDSPR